MVWLVYVKKTHVLIIVSFSNSWNQTGIFSAHRTSWSEIKFIFENGLLKNENRYKHDHNTQQCPGQGSQQHGAISPSD